MRKAVRGLAYVIFVIVALAGAFAAYVAITGIPTYSPAKVNFQVDTSAEKVARGKKYASMLCVACHLDPSTGRLTGAQLVDLPSVFGQAFSKNITRDPAYGIGAWTDGELAYFLRTGVKRTGQYAPPWMPKYPHMSDEDLGSVIAFLRSDDPLTAPAAVKPPGVSKPSFVAKLLTHLVFKPLPYPKTPIQTPSISDQVVYGRYLSVNLGCFACHSANFRTNNELEPEKSAGYMGGGNELQDQSGQPIRSANLTPDESGLANWSEGDFTRAIRTGIRPDHTVLMYPMSPLPELNEAEVTAIYAYLRTVPKIHNPVPRAVPHATGAGASQGKQLYYRYGCNSCHGDSGIGVGDLRRAAQDYPTNPQLEAFIRHAPSFRPGTKMPAWNGIIAETDYAPLIEYLRELGRVPQPAGSAQ